MFFFSTPFYVFTVILQAICVIHCVRRGNTNNWIWLIIFLPLIGSLVYIFTEIINRRDIQRVQSGVGSVFNPSGTIRKLENNLKFSDTFANRVALADAYLSAGQHIKAIDLYESSLYGNFEENEYVLNRLIHANYLEHRYAAIIPVAKKIHSLPQFPGSRSHIMYATALGYTGQAELAEKEFRSLKTRFSNYEARYQYGLFLERNNRLPEAKNLFNEMLEESSHLSSKERRFNREWFVQVREQLKRINTV
jgi:hypothetical protein